MKYIFGFLLSAGLYANPLSDSANNDDAKDFEALLPSTLVIKDGQVIGSLDVNVSSEVEARNAIESGNLPSAVTTIDESKLDHLKDSSSDSYYFYYTYGAYYNPYALGYGYQVGRFHYAYNPYYAWNGYNFYRYNNAYFYRGAAGRGAYYRYYWW